jgi:hypothetical protein
LNASLRFDDAVHNLDKAVAPQFLFSTHGHSPIKASVPTAEKEADGNPLEGISLTARTDRSVMPI